MSFSKHSTEPRSVVRRACWLALALTALASPAKAQRDPVTAEALFRAARKAVAAGDHAAACEKFKESNRLDPAVGTELNIAICEEELGSLATAWQRYQHVVHKLSRADRRYRVAAERAQKLEPRVPRLVIQASPTAPASLWVRRGGTELTRASFGVGLPLDPGKHTVTVGAEGHEDRSYDVELAEGERKAIEVEPGPEIAGEEPTAAAPTKAPPIKKEVPRSKEPDEPSGGQTTIGWVLTGVGGAGIATGLVTGALVLDRKSTVDRECNGGRVREPEGRRRRSLRSHAVDDQHGGLRRRPGGSRGRSHVDPHRRRWRRSERGPRPRRAGDAASEPGVRDRSLLTKRPRNGLTAEVLGRDAEGFHPAVDVASGLAEGARCGGDVAAVVGEGLAELAPVDLGLEAHGAL